MRRFDTPFKMLRPTQIRFSRNLFIGLIALFLQMTVNAQEETVIDNKGNIISVRNNVVTTAAIAPTTPVENDIWFDTTTNLTKIYDGTSWLIILEDALALKEDSANKSTDITLSDGTNVKFPTELAVKTYVDTQINGLSTLADGTLYIGDGSNTAQEVAISGDATISNTGVLTIANDAVTAVMLHPDVAGTGLSQNAATGALNVDALAITDVINGNKIATVTEADGTIVEIDETITTLAEVSGSEGTLRFTNEAGGFNDIPNIVRSVNGVNPAANGNVAVILSSTSTGLEANRPTPASPTPPVDSDIYIVSGEVAPNADRNGVAFIYDDVTGWQEVTTDLSSNDARYVNVIGDAMTGPLAMGTNAITGVGDPANPQDVATKNYVDNLNVNDADSDITNEIQDLTFVSGVIALSSDPGSTTIDLSNYDTNASDDFSGDFTDLTNVPAGLADGDDVDDADSDITNEIQDLTFVSGVIALSSDPGSTTIDLSNYDTNASDDFSGSFTDLTNVPAGLADGDDVDDADNNPSNEIQTLSLSGNDLSISSGNMVTLPSISETTTSLNQDTTTGVITYSNEALANQTANTVGAETNNGISVGANGGAFYESPIKAFGKISAAGTITKATAGITVAKLAGNGHYRVTLPAGTTTDANYIIQLTQPGRGGAGNDDPGISYSNQTTTTFEVIIGDNDNGGTDRARFNSEFMFTILDL